MSAQYSIRANNRKRRTARLKILLSVSLVGLVLMLGGAKLYLRQSVVPKSPAGNVLTTESRNEASTIINHGLPVRLQIAKLGVDTKILNMGVTKTGNMDVPTSIKDTGWYKFGALPGNTGTAVIAGHLDGPGNMPGVFADLHKLAAGDIVSVTDSNGLVTPFVIRSSRNYDQNAQPTEVFTSTSGSHLNLITCTGSWDSAEHRFAQRLVVFADKQAL